jgi:DNA-binding response OmpR family regulator
MRVAARAIPNRAVGTHAATPWARVLVVDDDGDARALMTTLLRRDGLEVVEADDGNALRSWIELMIWAGRHPPFDAVITDLQMPGPSALEVLERFSHRLRAPVILVTAFGGDASRRREAYDLGVHMVLAKPYVHDDLRAAVRSVLQRHPDRP